MSYWLVKTEASVYSVDDFKRDKVTVWGGVRNYQARNFLKAMQPGDPVYLYHSVDQPTGIVGLVRVKKAAYPDPSQFDKNGEYFDPKASKDNPRWFAPDLEFVERYSEPLALAELKSHKGLSKMLLLQRGSRLSVQPLSADEFKLIAKLVKKS